MKYPGAIRWWPAFVVGWLSLTLAPGTALPQGSVPLTSPPAAKAAVGASAEGAETAANLNRPGETILYTLIIEPKGGFDQPVSLRLDVSALFLYRNSFDLGSVSPPYPRTFEYLFRVPDDVPGGVTVKGVLIAEGGGHKEEQDLILLVGM